MVLNKKNYLKIKDLFCVKPIQEEQSFSKKTSLGNSV